jgi:hypothetical protein
MNSNTFNWSHCGLAVAQAAQFCREQERGRFQYDELRSVAVEAQLISPGANYAKKAIRGALLDFARDAHKLVRDVEMSEGEFHGTRGSPVPKQAAIRRVYVLGGVRHTLFTPGAYRTNHELLAGDGKVDSRHGKVSVEIERTTYNDEWGQSPSGWIRAKIEDDQQEFDASARMAQPRGDVDQADYARHGREKRFSGSCHNGCADHKSGLGERLSTGERPCDGKVVVLYPNGPNPKLQATIRRSAVAPPADVGMSGRRTSSVIVDLRKFGLAPVPKNELRHWREELAAEPRLRAGSSLVAWQREAGYFRPCREDWGFPDRPNGWGDNWLKAYLDRWELVLDKNYLSLRLKSGIWADVISRDSVEQGAPSRSALGSPRFWWFSGRRSCLLLSQMAIGAHNTPLGS